PLQVAVAHAALHSLPTRRSSDLDNIMANHKSALKRIRSNEAKRLRNIYKHKTTRNAIKRLRDMESKSEAEALFPEIVSMIDKLADRKSTRLNSSHVKISYAVFCL